MRICFVNKRGKTYQFIRSKYSWKQHMYSDFFLYIKRSTYVGFLSRNIYSRFVSFDYFLLNLKFKKSRQNTNLLHFLLNL